MLPKLHEILAVEPDKEGTAKKLIEEGVITFTKKPDHFQGSLRRLEMFATDGQQEPPPPEDRKEIVDTVIGKLGYVLDSAASYYDVVLQKEATNQVAIADLVIDGVVIAKDIPATFLLGMETRLRAVHRLLESIPTLQPGIKWVPDDEAGKHICRRAHPETKYKTTKTFAHKVLMPPTDHHPAQIERWEETVNIGMYTTEQWSSMISPAAKSALLGRCDKMIQAVKRARRRANDVEVVKGEIGRSITDYIMG
jgi:hypothetical protein